MAKNNKDIAQQEAVECDSSLSIIYVFATAKKNQQQNTDSNAKSLS